MYRLCGWQGAVDHKDKADEYRTVPGGDQEILGGLCDVVACKRPDTTLRKGVDRVNYVVCSGCGATTAVEAIKSGYHATTKKDRIEQRLLE